VARLCHVFVRKPGHGDVASDELLHPGHKPRALRLVEGDQLPLGEFVELGIAISLGTLEMLRGQRGVDGSPIVGVAAEPPYKFVIAIS